MIGNITNTNLKTERERKVLQAAQDYVDKEIELVRAENKTLSLETENHIRKAMTRRIMSALGMTDSEIKYNARKSPMTERHTNLLAVK